VFVPFISFAIQNEVSRSIAARIELMPLYKLPSGP
jgi:hypothetical protein